MRKLLMCGLFISIMIIACSTPASKQNTKNIEPSAATKMETKTNTSSSNAMVNDTNDSSAIIRPIHKYKHQKKFKIK